MRSGGRDGGVAVSGVGAGAGDAYRPSARLRIGVTGHRTGRKLPPDVQPHVRATVEELVRRLVDAADDATDRAAEAFAPGGPRLSVVSSLAEGADRIVAEAGLAKGLALDVILPFPAVIYAEDFETAASREAFDALRTAARSVFELPPPDAGALSRKRGYEAAGLIMLAHADVLIAVWDEEEAAGIGGTARIVEQAVNEGAPVLLINPSAPGSVRLLWTGDLELPTASVRIEEIAQRPGLDMIPAVVDALLLPPARKRPAAHLASFYAEPEGASSGVPVYSCFLEVFGARRSLPDGPLPEPTPDRPWRSWFAGAKPADALINVVETRLEPALARADRLAVRYSEIYRSAFVYNYLASAGAALIAFLGLVPDIPIAQSFFNGWHDLFKLILVCAELLTLFVVLVILWREGVRHWHRRWLDCRRAAEWLRHVRILRTVGARLPIPRPRRAAEIVPADRDARLEQDDWVAWYVRSIEREAPPPSRTVDPAYLAEVRAALLEGEVFGQIRYNRINGFRMRHLAEGMEKAGQRLFAGPFVAAIAFLVAYAVQSGLHIQIVDAIRLILTIVAAACPLLGAALNAIRTQGEFEAVAHRSDATAARLERLVEALAREPLEFALVADRTQRAAEVMSIDVAQWQTLFSTRPLGLPA